MPYYSANSMDTLLLVAGEHHLVPVERGCVCIRCKVNMMTHSWRPEIGMLDGSQVLAGGRMGVMLLELVNAYMLPLMP